MKSVRSLLLVSMLLAIAIPAFAGSDAAKTAKSPEEMAKTALAKWKDTLKLTDEQAPKFEAVMMTSYQKMADAKTAAAGDKAKLKASMTDIFKERDASVEQILTPEQMKTYRAKMAEMSKKGTEHMKKAAETPSK
jgi:Spy/CpxP family protein refolding chaperone